MASPYIVRMSTNNGIKGYLNQNEQITKSWEYYCVWTRYLRQCFIKKTIFTEIKLKF